MASKEGIKTGDMVGWNSSGGHAMGRVEHIMRDGVLGIPNSKFKINATKEDPAVLVRIYRNGEETETLVGHKMSTLKKGYTKQLDVKKYNSSHDRIGRFASAGHGDDATGIAPNGDDNMAAMDMMDIKRPPRSKRKLTASEQKILNRITSPAGNMIRRPGDNPGVYNAPFSAPTQSGGGITGYVPNSGITEQPGAGGM
jgi:hypothetical protein